MRLLENLNYGADPEYFSTVWYNRSHHVVSPALLEKDSGLKYLYQDIDEKHPVYIEEGDFSWMMDGVAWELTIKKPLKTPVEMYNILNNSTTVLSQFLDNFKWRGMKLHFYKKPTVNINPEWYLPFLNERKMFQGFIFGCDRDYDAIDSRYYCSTIDAKTYLKRHGGGHLHISGLEEFKYYPKPAIKALAITVGNFVVANSQYPTLERSRVKIYGRPGRFRKQHYRNGEFGVEYRTPSNSWTSLPLEKIEELFYWSEIACLVLINKRVDFIERYLNSTIHSIERWDVENSRFILEDIKSSVKVI